MTALHFLPNLVRDGMTEQPQAWQGLKVRLRASVLFRQFSDDPVDCAAETVVRVRSSAHRGSLGASATGAMSI
jgi:hypothetical protein